MSRAFQPFQPFGQSRARSFLGGALRAALSLAVALSQTAALSANAEPDEAAALEETLAGFDDDDTGGFDDEEDLPQPQTARASSRAPEAERFWDWTGGFSLGASYNYLNHQSATGTHYGNLSRLRAQLDLQLDLALPASWSARIEGYGFYDFAYLSKGRSHYTADVLGLYEWEVDFREVWLRGSLGADLDLKLGRQIVNWGRSDSLRVLDVLNPLDNREPGLTDIEDLRLPVTMVRIDYYPKWIPKQWGNWSIQGLVIPEFRSDFSPAIGSDFNPTPIEIAVPSNQPNRFFDTPEFGGAITGTFSGWDVSLYGARIHLHQPLVAEPLGGLLERYPRVTMVGAGGNLTMGSWLLKTEMGFFDGIEYNRIDASGLPPTASVVEKKRLDTMAGVEYYGISDLQIALEVVHRHIFDYEAGMNFRFNGIPIAYAKEDLLETALRVTADFFNARLKLTGVAILFGTLTDVGSVIRLEARYELRDALLLSGGLVLYQKGTSPVFNNIGDNDRLFIRLEYNF